MMKPILPVSRWYYLAALAALFFCLMLFSPLLAESAGNAGILGQTVRPATPKTPNDDELRYIYVVPLSHLDIGYNIAVSDLIPLQKQFLDDAITYAEQYPDYRWTIESAWQLDQWLAQTDDPQQVTRLRALLDQGKIELMANYANMHQGMMGREEFNRALYPARVYEDAWGLNLETAISDDVPGSSWALPQALVKNGVHNLVAGIETAFGGKPDIPVSDYLFNWQGIDGSEVLTWVSVKGYDEGIFSWRFTWDYPDMAAATQNFIDAYENNGYPYDAVMALIGFDNDAPDVILGDGLENIAQWNQEHTWPQIIVGTPTDFFNHVRQEYGNNGFTTYSGDWSGLWESNNTRYPVTMAQNRSTQNVLPAAETLAGVRLGLHPGVPYAQGLMSRTYRDLLVQDEHSGPGIGLGLTVAEIEANNQWYFDHSSRAQQIADSLLRRELVNLALDIAADQPALVVYNGLSWPRSDLVGFRAAQLAQITGTLAADWQLIDLETGQPVPLQVTRDGQGFIFLAQNVPAFGYRLYGIQGSPASPAAPQTLALDEIENDAYRVIVNADTGEIASIYDKLNARELVDANAPVGFNQLVRADQGNAIVWGYWQLVPPGDVTVTAEIGPVQSRLTIVRSSSPISETVITLPANLPRVEIRNTLDHDSTAFADRLIFTWWYYAVMPFALGDDFTGRFQSPNGWLNPQVDWIPGTSHNSRVIRHGSDLRAADGFGVTVANRESYLAAFGSLAWWNAGEPVDPILFQNVFARQDGANTEDQGWVNFPTWEPGAPRTYTYHFAITSSAGGFDAAAAEQFSGGYNLPLWLAIIRQPHPGVLPGPAGSLIAISEPNVAALTLKQAEFENPDGADLILRLQEVVGQPQTTVTITFPFSLAWAEINGMGEQRAEAVPLPINPLQLTLSAHETVTIRLRPVSTSGD